VVQDWGGRKRACSRLGDCLKYDETLRHHEHKTSSLDPNRGARPSMGVVFVRGGFLTVRDRYLER
jgi:hypothetical protein